LIRRTRELAVFVLLVGSATASPQPATCQGAKFPAQFAHSVRLDGSITPDTTNSVVAGLSNQPNALVVNSFGGDDLSAIRLAQLIERLHTTVVVNGVCMSACAEYLFLAAPKRIVLGNSLVVFHHSPDSLLALADGRTKTKLNQTYGGSARLGDALLRRAGVAPAILLRAQVEMKTLCWLTRPTNDASASDVFYESHFAGWVPSRQTLASYGASVEGYWPHSSAELDQTIRQLTRRSVRIAFGKLNRAASSASTDIDALRQVPACPIN